MKGGGYLRLGRFRARKGPTLLARDVCLKIVGSFMTRILAEQLDHSSEGSDLVTRKPLMNILDLVFFTTKV